MTIGYSQLVSMFHRTASLIRANVDLLTRLDSVGGDGDHGTTMLRGMEIVEKSIAACGSGKIKDLLEAVGWGLMGVDGGATGPLLGTFFGGMADAADGAIDLDSAALASALESGLAKLQKMSKAKVGDKTMMDALIPAVAAARQAAASGDALAVLRAAQEAAATGAESTTRLQARFGRARNIGPKSIGSPDAGATSISLIFKGFLEGANTHG